VHVRRAYTDGRHGQLHLTTAYPSGGGFDERTPLICLHPEHSSGSWFRTLLPELGKARSVYAPDLPAHGQSDPVDGDAMGIADHLAAMADFLESMRLRSVDLLGHGLGAMVAAELAVQRPEQVRRVALVIADDAPGGQGVSHQAKGGTLRVMGIAQPALLLYPASGKVQRPEAVKQHHTVTMLRQPVEELYGSGVKEMARLLVEFLDRQGNPA